jgi:hypothetical protein
MRGRHVRHPKLPQEAATKQQHSPGTTLPHRKHLIQLQKMVPPSGFEPLTYGLGNRRSIRLSYGDAVSSRQLGRVA